MAIGLYMILFVTLSAVSIAGLVLLFLLRQGKARKWIFYFMAAWSMLIAVLSATSFPSNYVANQMAAWGFGFLSVAGLAAFLKGKSKAAEWAAYLLVSLSAIGGILFLFFF